MQYKIKYFQFNPIMSEETPNYTIFRRSTHRKQFLLSKIGPDRSKSSWGLQFSRQQCGNLRVKFRHPETWTPERGQPRFMGSCNAGSRPRHSCHTYIHPQRGESSRVWWLTEKVREWFTRGVTVDATACQMLFSHYMRLNRWFVCSFIGTLKARHFRRVSNERVRNGGEKVPVGRIHRTPTTTKRLWGVSGLPPTNQIRGASAIKRVGYIRSTSTILHPAFDWLRTLPHCILLLCLLDKWGDMRPTSAPPLKNRS